MSQAVLEKILEGKIIAIVRGIPSTKIVGLAQALEKGGVNCIEVTFDQTSEEKAKDTLAAIRAIKDALGDKVCVGAGTVMSVEQVHQAVEAGAEYMTPAPPIPGLIFWTGTFGSVIQPSGRWAQRTLPLQEATVCSLRG